MTKQELEQAIKNGDSIWYVVDGEIVKKKLDDTYKVKFETILLNKNKDCVEYIRYVYKTKAQAQHYFKHGNIIRIENLPFVDWEEFKNLKEINFRTPKGIYCSLEYCLMDEKKYIIRLEKEYNYTKDFEATEENFYKAYDECVKLFKGE